MSKIDDKNLNLIAVAITEIQTYTDLYQFIHIDSQAVADQKDICVAQALLIGEIMGDLSIGTDKHPFMLVLEEYFKYCEDYFVYNKINNAIRLSWATNIIWENMIKYFPEHTKLKIPS